MRLFAILRALAPLLVLACALLGAAHAQLAAYSETRSFRDALEGRSMEEAISGPVDKDTSSYGERTADSSGATSGGAPPASSTMMSIPANGNLQQQQQQVQVAPMEEQQQKSGGGELEREAGPIGPNYSEDGQQMMEQTVRAKQMRAASPRNGRLMRMMSGPMNARTGRLQQQQADKASGQEPANYGGQQQDTQMASPGGADFGDEQMNGGAKQQKAKMGAARNAAPGASSTSGYEQQEQEPQNGGSQNGYADRGQQQMRNGVDSTTDAYSQMMAPATGDQQQSSYEARDEQQQQQQQQMAARQMEASSGSGRGQRYGSMEGSNGPQKQQYGAESMGMKMARASGMAQSMMMSLANKASYAAGQREQVSQRQVAPPMMQAAGQQSYRNNGVAASAGQQQMPMNSMNGRSQMNRDYGQMSGAARLRAGPMGGSMRPMRRANQRKSERKMSPAMMNAMLNRMLSARMQQTAESGVSSGGQYGGGARSPASSMLMASNMMKSPAGAEMLANMMVMSANGAAQMSAAKKKQYKQMLMEAMMQQQQQQTGDEESEAGYEQASEQPTDKYGQRSRPAPASMMTSSNGNGNGMSSYANRAAAASNGPNGGAYGQSSLATGDSMAPAVNSYGQMSSPSSGNGMAAAMMLKMQKMQAANGYQQKQMQEDGQQQKMDSMEGQQREMAPTEANYGKGAGSTTMRPAMSMANGANNYASMGSQMMNLAAMGAYNGNANGNGNSGLQMMQMARRNKMEMASKMYGGQQQEKQRMEAAAMGGAGYGAQQMGSEQQKMDQPMNGFGQAYKAASGQQQQQQQQQRMVGQDDEREQYGGQGQQRELGKSGTKMGPANEGTKSASSARPMQQMSYGNNEGAEEAGDQQQQAQREEEEQKQEGDGYGSAPMGQAEPFAFNYKTQDNYGNEQYRKEESDKNGVVRGSYGYMDQSGIFRHVEYVADENGFRANVKSNEPGLSNEQAPGPVGSSNAGKTSPSQTDSPVGADSPATPSSPGLNEGAGNGMSPPMGPVAPPSSSSSLGGSSGTGDASLRLQQQDNELPMTPMMEMAAGMMQQAAQRSMQQEQRQYGGMSDNGSGIEK